MANIKTLNVASLDNSGGSIVFKKGGGVTINNQQKTLEITENGTTEVTPDAGFTGLGKVIVNTHVPQGGGGGGGVSAGAVTYYDYDGKVLHSFSVAEYEAMTEHPQLPTRAGLTCQGWNWSFENAKAYASKYGMVNVGATYITDDGKTRFYIKIAAEGRMDVPLNFTQTEANGVVVDWGDGSATESFSGTTVAATHKYASIGEYCITMEVVSGTMGFSEYVMSNNYTYSNMLRRVEIGSGVTSIGTYAFGSCYSLSSINITEDITSIGTHVFSGCRSLSSIVIPDSFTSIEEYFMSGCYSLSSVVIPDSVTNIKQYAFSYCSSLYSVVIPDSVTNIGNKSFQYCRSLHSVFIPDSVTSLGERNFSNCSGLISAVIGCSPKGYYMFENCSSLLSVEILEGATSFNQSTFHGCTSLISIVIPQSITSLGSYTFQSCSSLRTVNIPDSVKYVSYNLFYSCSSLYSILIPDGVVSIESSAFYGCKTLPSVIIPATCRTIAAQAFYNCSNLRFLDFSSHTSVPTLSNSNAFNNVASDCQIVVPDALYDDWIAATNWSSHASKIVKASEFVKP